MDHVIIGLSLISQKGLFTTLVQAVETHSITTYVRVFSSANYSLSSATHIQCEHIRQWICQQQLMTFKLYRAWLNIRINMPDFFYYWTVTAISRRDGHIWDIFSEIGSLQIHKTEDFFQTERHYVQLQRSVRFMCIAYNRWGSVLVSCWICLVL